MWRSLPAPKDGQLLWLGNSKTGQMRLAKWGRQELLHEKEYWHDVVTSECAGGAPVRIDFDCWHQAPDNPRTDMLDPDLVDHLANVFWQHHREPMLRACNDVSATLASARNINEAQAEPVKEAIRVGIRAVLEELKLKDSRRPGLSGLSPLPPGN